MFSMYEVMIVDAKQVIQQDQGEVLVFLVLATAESVALNVIRHYNIWDYASYIVSIFPASVWLIIGTPLFFVLAQLQARSVADHKKAKTRVKSIYETLSLIFKRIAHNHPEDAAQEHKATRDTREFLLTYYAAFCCEMGYMTYDHYIENFPLAKNLNARLGLLPVSSLGPLPFARLGLRNSVWSPLGMTIQRTFRELEKNKIIDHKTKLVLDELIHETQLLTGSCLALRGWQKHPSVASILLWLTVFQCFTLPFYLCSAYHWYSVPITMIYTFSTAGMYFCSISLAAPFGPNKKGYANSRKSKQELKQDFDLDLLSHGVDLELGFMFFIKFSDFLTTTQLANKLPNDKGRLDAVEKFELPGGTLAVQKVVDRWHAHSISNASQTVFANPGRSFI
jgi:hypothetical protein